MTAMYTRTVTLCKARHLRNYIAQEVGYNVDFTFDYDKDEVKATFTCSDDFADPHIRHNREDLETYIIKRYGAFLVKEDQPKPNNFAMDMKKICEILTNPNLQASQKDSYQVEYEKILDKSDYLQLKKDIPNLPPLHAEDVIIRPDWQPNAYRIRLGLWHG